MPRATITAQLEALEQQISLSAANIASQIALIERERTGGFNPGTSDATLAILKVALAAQEANRDRLRAELAALTGR